MCLYGDIRRTHPLLTMTVDLHSHDDHDNDFRAIRGLWIWFPNIQGTRLSAAMQVVD
jgi:hypothetical protein